MVPSRSLLFLVAALALPLSVFTGCSDDSKSGDEAPQDEDSDDEDKGGEQKDSGVRSMDGSLRSDATIGSRDGAVEADDAGDAGDLPRADGGDAGGSQDAAVEGMDAATNDAATQDASKPDATVEDSSAPDASEPEEDASVPEQDAGNDAGSDAGDAGDAGSDAGNTDAGGGFTEEDCTEAGGAVTDDECADGQTKYELIGDNICCVPPGPSDDGTCGGVAGIPCKDGEFCDTSLYNGGEGCGDDALGKCRPIPQADCSGVPPLLPGCGCDGQLHTVCDSWKDGAPLEPGDISCLVTP